MKYGNPSNQLNEYIEWQKEINYYFVLFNQSFIIDSL